MSNSEQNHFLRFYFSSNFIGLSYHESNSEGRDVNVKGSWGDYTLIFSHFLYNLSFLSDPSLKGL